MFTTSVQNLLQPSNGNKLKYMKKIFLVLFIIIICSFSTFAQNEKSTKTEVINGVEYYLHEIQKGQTFYGISKIYNISVDTIVKYNPEITGTLKIGSVIKIPTYKKVTKTEVKQTNNQTQNQVATPSQWHTVVQGESLYSISKKYNTNIETIKKLNPGISESLSIGQRVEVPSAIKTDQTPIENKNNKTSNDSVKTTTTNVIPAEVKVDIKDSISIKPQESKNKITSDIYIALMVPLYTNQIQNINLGNIKTPTDITNTESFRFIQFYLGFLNGLKQFENKGIAIHLNVYDVSDGVTSVKKIINEPSFSKTHLIVGPLFSSTFIEAQKWADQNGVFIINPFSMQSNIVSKSLYTFKLTCEATAKHENLCKEIETQFPDANIIIVYNKTNDTISVASLKKYFANTKFKNKVKEVVFNEKGVNGINEFYEVNKPNVILNFLSGEATITNYVRRLYELKRDSLYIFCPSEWLSYDNIETEYLQFLNAHFYGDYYVDFRKQETKDFISNFIAEYGTEPTIEGYAFQGFDIATFFVGAMMEYKSDWVNKLDKYNPELLSLKIKFIKKSNESGNENTAIQIVRLCNYELIPFNENCVMDLEERKY